MTETVTVVEQSSPNSSDPMIAGPDITNYWQFFNLDRDPFSMGFDESLIYLSPGWEEMLDLVQYLVHYKNQLVVITGVPGSGKTTFEDVFISQLGETAHTVKLGGEPNLDVMRLVEFLSDAFTLPWTPNQNVEEVLDQQLEAFQAKDKTCILIVDNAHLLPEETIEALIYLVEQQSENQMRFHVVLLGDLKLIQTIKTILQPNEEALVHFLSIDAFGLEETQNYLNYRLSSAGWHEDSPMTEETTGRIYKLSEGNPARINRIARRFLVDILNARQNTKEASSMKSLLPRILGITVVVLLALAGFGYLYSSHSSTVAAKDEVSADAPNISLNGQTIELKPATPPDDTNLASQSPKAAESVPAKAVSPAPVGAPVPADNTPENVATSAIVSEPVTAAKAEVPPAAAVPVERATPVPVSPKTVPKTAKVKTSAAAAKKATPTAVAKPKMGNYAIQLIGLSQSQNVNKFIKDNHLAGKVTVKTITHNGKKTTMVLYGHYQTMHEAEQALATLPPALTKAGPWPRKIPV